jgi:hypothetical protein
LRGINNVIRLPHLVRLSPEAWSIYIRLRQGLVLCEGSLLIGWTNVGNNDQRVIKVGLGLYLTFLPFWDIRCFSDSDVVGWTNEYTAFERGSWIDNPSDPLEQSLLITEGTK